MGYQFFPTCAIANELVEATMILSFDDIIFCAVVEILRNLHAIRFDKHAVNEFLSFGFANPCWLHWI